MHQAVAARQNRHEGAEVHQTGDLALIDAADFDVRRDQLDAALSFAACRALHRCDLDRAVVFDVDRGAGLFRDLPDDRAALADHFADLLRIDLHRNDGRRPFGHVLARLGQHFVHLVQYVQAAVARLIQRHLHDLAGDARDLDVHLQRRDAVLGSGHLEIHVAEVILVAQDVGQHFETRAFLDQAHRNAGHRRFDRHAGIHQRKAGAAHRGHGTGAVRFENFRHHADDVREFIHARHYRLDAALGKIAVPDLAPLGRSHHAGFADAERRKIVVQHERLFAFAREAVDDLRVASRAQGRDDQCLGLAAREQRRAVSSRQHAGADVDAAHGLGVAAVDARVPIEDLAAHQPIFEIREFSTDLLSREFRCFALAERLDRSRLDFLDLRVALLLLGQRVRRRQIGLGKGAHRRLQILVGLRSGP